MPLRKWRCTLLREPVRIALYDHSERRIAGFKEDDSSNRDKFPCRRTTRWTKP